MKKVGIMTLYYNSYNYGGILQAYALRKVIEELGYDSRQISYDPDGDLIIRKIKQAIKNEMKKVVFGKRYNQYIRRAAMVKRFVLDIPHTKTVTDKNLSSLNKQFDVFVCGSDQIWNPIGWRPAYFLDFVDKSKRKISYAASIARDSLDDNEMAFLSGYIKDFYAVSVRESESEKFIKNIDGITVCTMPDPTLLIKKDDWISLADNDDDDEPYIFAYFLGMNESHMDMAVDYARKRGLKIKFIDGLRYKNCKWEKKNESCMKGDVGVDGFLSLILNANMIITDSFHGAVFSILFERPFVILNRFHENDSMSMNSRTKTLMQMMNLNRIVKELDRNSDYHYLDSELESIRTSIEYQREKGISFLRESLQE